MTADLPLPPEVRAEVAKAAARTWYRYESTDRDQWLAVVDAVVSVVLPAHQDALKAENDKLHTKIRRQREAIVNLRDQLARAAGEEKP